MLRETDRGNTISEQMLVIEICLWRPSDMRMNIPGWFPIQYKTDGRYDRCAEILYRYIMSTCKVSRFWIQVCQDINRGIRKAVYYFLNVVS